MLKSDAERIRQMGHRNFVGGDGDLWDKIALLQLEFLKSEGLKPEHALMDIACGSLRAGRLFIDYLNPGSYLGIDKEINLIIHGVADELGIDAFVEKKPFFVISGEFEFSKFLIRPDYAIAQSLLTHLTTEDIYCCFKSLREFVSNDCKFYATFFEVSTPINNYPVSDAINCFFYTREQMEMLADLSGWKMHYIGNWGHPREQKMIKLEAK